MAREEEINGGKKVSRNDIILIVKRDDKYTGVSWNPDIVMPDSDTIIDGRLGTVMFTVETIEEAIIRGQGCNAEYGIHFVNLPGMKKEKPKVCECCGKPLHD